MTWADSGRITITLDISVITLGSVCLLCKLQALYLDRDEDTWQSICVFEAARGQQVSFCYGLLLFRYFCFPWVSSSLFLRLLFFLNKASAYPYLEIPLHLSGKLVLWLLRFAATLSWTYRLWRLQKETADWRCTHGS